MNVHYAKFQKSLIVEQFQGNCLQAVTSHSIRVHKSLTVSPQRRQSSVFNTQNGPLAYWEALETKTITSPQFLYNIGWDSTQLTICLWWLRFTAPFNNMRTLKFKGQPTNAFFATDNQMFSGSSQPILLSSTVSLSELCSTIWLPPARQ